GVFHKGALLNPAQPRRVRRTVFWQREDRADNRDKSGIRIMIEAAGLRRVKENKVFYALHVHVRDNARERKMVRDRGFEPLTPSVSRKCSTTELTAHHESYNFATWNMRWQGGFRQRILDLSCSSSIPRHRAAQLHAGRPDSRE